MRPIVQAAAAATLLLVPGAAAAGVYTDDMSKCLVKATSPADGQTLVQWIFATMSAHPAVRPMSNLTSAQRDDYARKAVVILERLVMKDCRKESVDALKYEGSGAMENSFNVLGQVAMRDLMSSPQVSTEFGHLATMLNKSAWQALGKETGLPVAQ